MRTKICMILSLWAFSLSSTFCQNEQGAIYNISKTQEDIIAALDLIGVEIYRFDVSLPDTSKKYKLIFYIEEFIGGESVMIDEKLVIRSPYTKYVNHEKVPTVLKNVRVLVQKIINAPSEKGTPFTSVSFITNIYGARSSLSFYTWVNEHFNTSYGVTPFNQVACKEDAKHPLLMVGSYWYDTDIDRYRYCMSKNLDVDKSDDAFNLMPSYYILGYRLISND